MPLEERRMDDDAARYAEARRSLFRDRTEVVVGTGVPATKTGERGLK